MKPKVSSRLEPVRESAIRRFIELASKTSDVVHFEHGEPSFLTPRHIVEAAFEATRDGGTHYSPTPGLLELRTAISRKLCEENKLPIDSPEDVLVVAGTQEAMSLAGLAFLQAGDEALVLNPYYPAYYEETLLAGAKPIVVPLNEQSGYRLEGRNLEQYVTSRTKMIWLNSPSNPTGHVFSKRDLEEVAGVAERNDLLIFADEVYEKLVYDGAEHVSIGSLPGMEGRVITVNGFSKSYAMTGWRVGYAAAEKKLVSAMSKLHYYLVLCASTIAQKAAYAALTGPQNCVTEMVEEYDRRRKRVLEGIGKINKISYVRPNGAFYVFPNISRFSKDDESLAVTLLREFSVAAVPGSGFGEEGKGHLRLSFSVPISEIEEGMNRLRNGLEHFNSHSS